MFSNMFSVVVEKASVILAFKFEISGTGVKNTLPLTYPHVPFWRIGGRCRRGLFLDLIGFQMDWSLCLSVAMYVVNLSLLSLCIAVLSLLLALLYSRRSSGACVLCHFVLALRLAAIRHLTSEGRLWETASRFWAEVAICAACWRMPNKCDRYFSVLFWFELEFVA